MKKTLILSALSVVAAHADDAVEVLTVIGTRSDSPSITVPAFIQTISEEEIRQSGALTLADVLAAQTGLSVSDSIGNGGRGVSVSLRGFSENAGNNVLILVDGRKLNNPTLAGPDLSSVTAQSIARIEILQGSAGSLYGDQASAGVINIITKNSKTTSADVQLQAGSYQHRSVGLRFANQLNDEWSLQLSVANLSKDNYRDHNVNRHRDLAFQTRYQQTDLNVTLFLQNISDDLQLPGALDEQHFQDQPRFSASTDIADTKTIVRRLSGEWQISSQWSAWLDVTDRDLTSSGQLYSTPFRATTEVQSVQPRVVAEFANAHLLFGVDKESDAYDADYGFGVTDIAQDINDIYAQALLSVIPQLELSLAVRHSEFDFSPRSTAQDYSDSLDVFSLALNFNIDDASALYLRGDTGFRWPNVDENGFIDPAVDHLQAQESRSVELGFSQNFDSFSWKAALYQTHIDNEIVYDPSANGPFGAGTGANVNRDYAERNGALIDSKWPLTSALAVNAGIAYVDAQFDGGTHDGNQLPFNAKKTTKTQLQYQINDQWASYVEAIYTGSRYRAGDEANEQGLLGGYTVWNANLSWQYQTFALQLRLNNLLDKHYSGYSGYGPFSGPYYYAAAERNFVLTFSQQF